MMNDQLLRCSFCHKKFSRSIKMIPDCGESICSNCYFGLRSLGVESRTFDCRVCLRSHSMPVNGFPDNIFAMQIVQSEKSTRLVREPADELMSLVQFLRVRMKALRSYDTEVIINQHCDQLEQELEDAIKSVMLNLNAIRIDHMQRIAEYRERRLQDLNKRNFDIDKQQLEVVAKESHYVLSKWCDYFDRGDSSGNKKVIQKALIASRELDARLQSIGDRFQEFAFNGNKLIFKTKNCLLKDKDFLMNLMNLSYKNENEGVHSLAYATLNGHNEAVYQAIFLSDGNLATCSKDMSIKIWSVKEGKQLYQLEGHLAPVLTVAALSNGWLASGSQDRMIKLWDLKKRKVLKTLAGHIDSVISLKQLKTGELLSLSTDDTVKIWDPIAKKNNLLRTIEGHGNRCLLISLGLSLDGHLITCSSDRESEKDCFLKISDPKDGRFIKSIPTRLKSVWSMIIMSKGHVVLAFKNGSIQIIDPINGAIVRTKEKAHLGVVSALAELTNGRLVSAGVGGELYTSTIEIKVWTMPKFHLIGLIDTYHKGVISSLSISPDGRFIASASRDSSVKLWWLL